MMRARWRFKEVRLIVLFFAIAITSIAVNAQVARGAAPINPAAAPNAWMKTPTDASAPDVAIPSTRSERDAVWDGLIGARYELTPAEAASHGISEGGILACPPR